MIKRTRILSLIAAAAVFLPAAAQAHWNSWCGCQAAHHRYSYSHYHYRYGVPRERSYVAVELAPDVFAIPYRLRHYPYVSGGYGDDDMLGSGAPAVVGSDTTGRGQSRVIDADAQVTILGPDRMNIRLFRKGRGVVIHSDH
jgi:hypothetical protein